MSKTATVRDYGVSQSAIARYEQVDRRTVYRWLHAGKVKPYGRRKLISVASFAQHIGWKASIDELYQAIQMLPNVAK